MLVGTYTILNVRHLYVIDMRAYMKIKQAKKLSLLVIAMGFSCFAMAQQEPQFTQYMFNRMSYNPGYAGSSGSICATLMYRNQWMGFTIDKPDQGSAGSVPVDLLFTFDMPVKFLHGGIGLTFTNDKIGYWTNNVVNLDYAFRMFWGEGNLAAGVEVGLASKSLDVQGLYGIDEDDPVLNNIAKSAFLIDASVGAYYQVPSKYWIGLSVKNLLGAHDENIHFANARTAYLMGGYEFAPDMAPSFRLRPSFMLKTADLSYFQGEVTGIVDYRNRVWGGVSYRVQDAVAVLFGVHWKKLHIGFAYDLTTSNLGSFKTGRSFGTMEAYLKFCFKVVVPAKPGTSYGNTWLL